MSGFRDGAAALRLKQWHSYKFCEHRFSPPTVLDYHSPHKHTNKKNRYKKTTHSQSASRVCVYEDTNRRHPQEINNHYIYACDTHARVIHLKSNNTAYSTATRYNRRLHDYTYVCVCTLIVGYPANVKLWRYNYAGSDDHSGCESGDTVRSSC